MKVAIVGSRTYTNRKKIKEFIFNLKQKFGKELVVVSGGQKDGADGYAKKYSLEFNINYEEYPPQHYNHNIHCVLDARNYSKPYYVSNYFKRNKQIAERCDRMVAFVTGGKITNGTEHVLGCAKRLEKKYVIMD